MGSKLSEFVLKMCPAYTDTSTYRRRRVSRISLALGKRRCRVLMHRGAVVLKHKKIVSGQLVHVWQWPLSKKVVATVSPLHFGSLAPNLSNLVVTNPVLGKI